MREGLWAPAANSLLATLSRKKYQSLSTVLRPVTLAFGDVLLEPGQRIEYVFFPGNSLVSLLTEEGRRAVEVGLVGNEGMVGIPLALGVGVSPLRALVQGTGTALRMKKSDFLREFRNTPPLRRELFRYSHALMSQFTQISACNRLHAVEARLARWLLMTRDRVRSSDFQMTHEFLGHMLGVRRVGVTLAASALQKRKLISYRRGHIKILDSKGLETSSCRCYRVIKGLYSGR